MIKITEEERRYLSKPLGKVYGKIELIKLMSTTNKKIISVGDYTTITLLKNNIIPFIAVVDFKMCRKHISNEEKLILLKEFKDAGICSNPAGTISECVITWVENHIDSGGRLIVKGEEDLVAVPLICMLSKDHVLIYGQRGMGSVVVDGYDKEIDKDRFKVLYNIIYRR